MAVKRIVETEQQIRQRIHEAVSMDENLDGVDLRVFFYMSMRLEFNDCVYVPQLELATMLGRRKEHISRAIRRLIEAGVLVAGPKGTRASEWRLNPDYGR